MRKKLNIKMWTNGLQVDEKALQQITNIANLPIIAGHIAIMPDVHFGKGATVGRVIPTRGAIIPAAVGVDIGCGMCAMQTSLKARDLPDSLTYIRSCIEAQVLVSRCIMKTLFLVATIYNIKLIYRNDLKN
jgi:tRNA-splicing ligase RtcB